MREQMREVRIDNSRPQIVKERGKIDNASVELGNAIDKLKQSLEQWLEM